jgi:hypothetical protein
MSYLDLAKKANQCISEQSTTPFSQSQGYEVHEVHEVIPPPWDQVRADAALAAIHLRCNAALAREANTAARQHAIETCRAIAVQHHRDRDPLLWDELESLEAMLARWWRLGDPPPEDWCG